MTISFYFAGSYYLVSFFISTLLCIYFAILSILHLFLKFSVPLFPTSFCLIFSPPSIDFFPLIYHCYSDHLYESPGFITLCRFLQPPLLFPHHPLLLFSFSWLLRFSFLLILPSLFIIPSRRLFLSLSRPAPGTPLVDILLACCQ